MSQKSIVRMTTKQKIKYLEQLVVSSKPRKVNQFLWNKRIEKAKIELECLKKSKKVPIDPYASANIGAQKYRNGYTAFKYSGKIKPSKPSTGWCMNYNRDK